MSFEQSELILYPSDDGLIVVSIRLKNKTVWLSQTQMTKLFWTGLISYF
jgi:hypothetical protein